MAAWLARSLANSLRLDDDEHGGEFSGNEDDEEGEGGDSDVAPRRSSDSASRSHNSADHQYENRNTNQIEGEAVDEAQSRGVKEDLTELKHSLSRQLWGVANFLAPPASHDESSPSQSDPTVNGFDRLEPHNCLDYGGEGERKPSDEAISEMRVSEMDSKSDRVESVDESEFEEEELEDEYPVGVTDEVLAFARNIAMHPETWLDFPLDAEDDLDDFEMSIAQEEHAFAIENLAPRLRALRIEFCPCHMSESYFWKVYFVLLHSRLDKHDADILSTPQVVEARAQWMQELKKKTKEEYDWNGSTYRVSEYESEDTPHEEYLPDSPGYFHSTSTQYRSSDHDRSKSFTRMYNDDIEKHPIVSYEVQSVDKSVRQESSVPQMKDKDVLTGFTPRAPVQNFDDDEDDDWLKQDDSDLAGYSGAAVSIGMDEDVSFSDLEDDLDDVSMPIKLQPVNIGHERESS